MVKKIGRPTKLTEETIKTLCKSIRLGSTYELACKSAGISYTIFREWMAKGEKSSSGKFSDFADTIKKAEGDAANKWLKYIEDAAQNESWQAAAWKLERRYPKDYGKQIRQKTENIDIDISSLSNKQLQRLANGEDIANVLSDPDSG